MRGDGVQNVFQYLSFGFYLQVTVTFHCRYSIPPTNFVWDKTMNRYLNNDALNAS